MHERLEDLRKKGLAMGNIENSFVLIGLLSEFSNRLQSRGDTFFEEISWKQCFLLICLKLLPSPPTIRELSQLVGSSHQNVKQILMKLEKLDYINLCADQTDRRKLRVIMSDKARAFLEKYDRPSWDFMERLFHGVDPQQLASTIETLLTLDENLKTIEL